MSFGVKDSIKSRRVLSKQENDEHGSFIDRNFFGKPKKKTRRKKHERKKV